MGSHRLSFSKNNVLITLMIAFPVAGMGLLLLFLVNLPKNLPDWLMISIIACYLIFLTIGLLLLIIKKGTVSCKVAVNQHGITYKFENRSIFYRRNNFFSGWENISNISESSTNEQSSFYRITFANPSFTGNFSAIKNEEAEADRFFEEVLYYQECYNLGHQESPILAKNFYETAWARIITWLFYLTAMVIIILPFTKAQEIEWYRTISLFCFGIVWIGNYYRNTRKLY